MRSWKCISQGCQPLHLSRGGKLYSVVDLHNLGERNQIQIPAGMEVINLLTKAFDRGFVVQRRQNRPIIEMKGEKVERPFYEQTRKEPTSPRNENTEERRYRQRDVEIVEITPSSRRERITDNISLANRAKYWRKEKPRSSISPERKGSLYYMDEEDRRRRRQYAQEPIVIVAEPRRRYIRDRSLPPLAEKVGKTKTSGTQPSEFTGGTRAEVATEAEFDKSKSWPDKMMPDKGLNPEEDNASEAVQMTFDQEVRSKWESMIIEELKAADRQTAGSKSQVGKRHSLLKGEQGPTGDSHLERARDQSKDDIPFSTREESAIEADRALQDATIGVRGRPKSKDSTRKPSQPQSPELELGDTFNDCSWKGLDGEYAGDLEGPEQRENSGVEDMRESQSVVVNEATNDIVPQSDSGYASGGVVCTVETTQTQMQAWSGVGPSSFEDNEPKKEESVEQQDLTEIASVLSDYDEIGSRTEIRKSPEHLAAEDQIRAFFAQHSNIEALCRELLPQMGRERFVRNFRRLLKSYYKAQVKLARSNIEHSTVFLLRSKFQRERIALSVADRLDPKEEIRFDAEKDLQEIGDRTSRVQEWLKIQKAFALDDEPAETDANSPTLELSDDDEAEEIIANEHYQFPHIDRMKDFLGSSSPFRGLIIDLHLLLIPCQFQSLARTLLAIPSDSIDMTGEYRPTVVNSIKSAVDGVTKTQWNWWPLNQSIKPPINGYRRITWKCVSLVFRLTPPTDRTQHCRRKLWQDIPKEYIDQFRRLIPLRGSQTIGTHICAQLFARPNKQQLAGRNGTMLARLPFRTVPSPHSSPHNQTPTQAAAVATQSSPSQRSSSSSSSRPSSRMSGTSSMGQAPSSATSIASLSASINIPGTEDFVLLGINGTRRTLDLVHIKTTKENDDDLKFFDTLLKSYKSLRGTMRRWFSVWHLNHCDFVKVSPPFFFCAEPISLSLSSRSSLLAKRHISFPSVQKNHARSRSPGGNRPAQLSDRLQLRPTTSQSLGTGHRQAHVGARTTAAMHAPILLHGAAAILSPLILPRLRAGLPGGLQHLPPQDPAEAFPMADRDAGDGLRLGRRRQGGTVHGHPRRLPPRHVRRPLWFLGLVVGVPARADWRLGLAECRRPGHGGGRLGLALLVRRAAAEGLGCAVMMLLLLLLL